MDKKGSFKNKDVKQTITWETTGKFRKRSITCRHKKIVYTAFGSDTEECMKNTLQVTKQTR